MNFNGAAAFAALWQRQNIERPPLPPGPPPPHASQSGITAVHYAQQAVLNPSLGWSKLQYPSSSQGAVLVVPSHENQLQTCSSFQQNPYAHQMPQKPKSWSVHEPSKNYRKPDVIKSQNSYQGIKYSSSSTFYCEPCDKEFVSTSALDTHLKSHESCSHPGCCFSGTRKVVSAHYHGSHGQFSGSGYKMIDVEGQIFKVLMGTDPLEVQQWRLERKSKFPSASNTLKRDAHAASLHLAGGLNADQHSNLKRKRVGDQLLSSVERELGINDRPPEDRIESSSEIKSAVVETDFSGADIKVSENPQLDSQVFALRSPSADCKRKSCAKFRKGSCKYGDSCNFSHDPDKISSARGGRLNKSPSKLILPIPLGLPGSESSLLAKLFKSDLEIEENIILQCIRILADAKRN